MTCDCVIVSGANGGIGSEVVRRFSDQDLLTVGIDLKSPENCDLGLAVDLGNDNSVQAIKQHTRQVGAQPKIIVHCAGISIRRETLATSSETWASDYNINVISAVRLVQACVPTMIDAGRGGAIIFVSSINAQVATPDMASYAATKAALDSLTRTLALELAPHRIRVNAVAPASIDTPMLRAGFERADNAAATEQANIARHPLGRLGTPSDVADLIAFLASDKADWITGTVQPIDGGALVTRR